MTMRVNKGGICGLNEYEKRRGFQMHDALSLIIVAVFMTVDIFIVITNFQRHQLVDQPQYFLSTAFVFA